MFLLEQLLTINFSPYNFDRDAAGLYGPGNYVTNPFFNKVKGFNGTGEDSFAGRNRAWAVGLQGWPQVNLPFEVSPGPLTPGMLDLMLTSPLENAMRSPYNARSFSDPFNFLMVGNNLPVESFSNPSAENNPFDFTSSIMTSTPHRFYSVPYDHSHILDFLMCTIQNPALIESSYNLGSGYVANDLLYPSPIGFLNTISDAIMNTPTPGAHF